MYHFFAITLTFTTYAAEIFYVTTNGNDSNGGITNLEKFAFGLDGSRATSYAESANFKQSNDGANATFHFLLNKNINLATKAKSSDSIKVKVLTSEDLVIWSEDTSAAEQIGESGDLNLYKLEKAIPEGGKLFFKLEASQE